MLRITSNLFYVTYNDQCPLTYISLPFFLILHITANLPYVNITANLHYVSYNCHYNKCSWWPHYNALYRLRVMIFTINNHTFNSDQSLFCTTLHYTTLHYITPHTTQNAPYFLHIQECRKRTLKVYERQAWLVTPHPKTTLKLIQYVWLRTTQWMFWDVRRTSSANWNLLVSLGRVGDGDVSKCLLVTGASGVSVLVCYCCWVGYGWSELTAGCLWRLLN